MVRKPRHANEWQLWYFASKDAGVAHTLSRRFFWSDSILWKEDIAAYEATIFLSERDLIVDSSCIYAYLAGHKSNNRCSAYYDTGIDGKFRVVWCTGLDHGQIFDGGPWHTRLMNEVLGKVSKKH